MQRIIYYFLALILLFSCTKEDNPRVDIYLLKSFTKVTNVTTSPGAVEISNAVLENKPLVNDADIQYYIATTNTFKLRKDIGPTIKDYATNTAFAITVNSKAVYYGLFHPGYLSSTTLGVATIDPILFNNNELKIRFTSPIGLTYLAPFDKRNDSLILNALNLSGRLR